jgi:hypothetical protein
LRLPLCIRFKPETIATACIYLAARALQIPLPESPNPWWELFDATWSEIEEISRTIMNLYRMPKATYIRVIEPEPTADEEGQKTPKRQRTEDPDKTPRASSRGK